MEDKNRTSRIVKAANSLSLGISMVVAIIIGIFLGKALACLYPPLFWFGVFLGVCAAILNVYKAYKLQVKMWDEERLKRENHNPNLDNK